MSPLDCKRLNLMGSEWQNSETETIASNIIFIQNKMGDGEKWVSFSWSDYCENCTHSVGAIEKGVLDALVNGGKPVWNTSVCLQPGYLDFVDGRYYVTEKFIDVLGKLKI